MDGTSVSSYTMNIKELPTWNVSDVPEYPLNNVIIPREECPFRCRPDINDKIVIWTGPLSHIVSHGMVSLLPEYSQIGSNLSKYPWLNNLPPDVVKELRNCRTGEAKISKSYTITGRFLIHTLGPRYNRRYLSASETALYNCYRNSLMLAIDNKIVTIAIPPLHSISKNYPVDQGANIALRTIRRFLERAGDSLGRILLQFPDKYETEYNKLLPLYFPRNRSEEIFSARSLPLDIGDENGAPIRADRTIRIFAHPSKKVTVRLGSNEQEISDSSSESDNEVAVEPAVEASETLEDLTTPGSHPFAKMEINPDQRRRQRQVYSDRSTQARLSVQRRYERLLRRARQVDMSVIGSLRCLYQCGTDLEGRPIILVVAKYFPALTINYRDAILYFVNLMDKIVNDKYIIIYMHTETTSTNQPPLSFIKEVYNLVDSRYKSNLHAFYMVHPTFWARVLAWFFTTFTTPQVKSKVYRISYLSDLYQRINPRQLDLPEFCYDYDKRISGRADSTGPHLHHRSVDVHSQL